jgi:hypothetical protein
MIEIENIHQAVSRALLGHKRKVTERRDALRFIVF